MLASVHVVSAFRRTVQVRASLKDNDIIYSGYTALEVELDADLRETRLQNPLRLQPAREVVVHGQDGVPVEGVEEIQAQGRPRAAEP